MTLTEKINALEGRLQAADAALRVIRNAPMARYTSLHLGGPADLLARSPARIAATSSAILVFS